MKKEMKIEKIMKVAGKRRIISDKDEAWRLLMANVERKKEGLPIIEYELSPELEKQIEEFLATIAEKRSHKLA